MVKVKEDLTGRTFGRLTVLAQVDDYVAPNGRHFARWCCQCNCKEKNIIETTAVCLTQGRTKSCGCFRKERIKETHKKSNDYEIQEDYVIMYTQKGEPFYVDLDDFWKVRDICWYVGTGGYIYGQQNGKYYKLHRFIMNCPDDVYIDHINGSDTLYDNRKSNLRIATPSQNSINHKKTSRNKSGIVGVYQQHGSQKWIAQISKENKKYYLGTFDTFEDAVKVRKEAELKYFGEFAPDYSRREGQDDK